MLYVINNHKVIGVFIFSGFEIFLRKKIFKFFYFEVSVIVVVVIRILRFTQGVWNPSVSRFIKQFYFCNCSPFNRTLISKYTCRSHCIAQVLTRTLLEVGVSSQFLLLNRFLSHSQVDRFGT